MDTNFLISEAGEAVSVRRALREGADFLSRSAIESARLDAEVILGEVLGAAREKLYLDYELELENGALGRFRSLLLRRARREPVAYITGRREFWSLDFLVTPAVLVPRPETELLVEAALKLTEQSSISDFGFRILDLGTGSGAIAVALAKEISGAEIWATDISADALEVARANARSHCVEEKIRFVCGDLCEPVRDRRGFFHLIISNPPYVRRGELDTLPREARDFEPRIALDGGADGLDFYRRIIPRGRLCLAAGGWMALEIGDGMGVEVERLFAEAGCYDQCRLERDYAGKERVISARRKCRDDVGA